MKALFWILVVLICLFVPPLVNAQETSSGGIPTSGNRFITIVNPVRVSTYSDNPVQSLVNQYQEVHVRNFPATWLFTYDAFLYPGIFDVVSEMDQKQETGIFFEVTPVLAKDSGVIYPKVDSWHRAKAVFLSGYSPHDREKIIDQVMSRFYKQFGFYPKSVGSWWLDSYSLNYLKERYKIENVLTCADQFSTDGYQIWGQYWSTPFYPSKRHAGMPAQSKKDQIGVVSIQWAMRDPLNGYLTPGDKRASLYSTQDYFTVGLDAKYLKKLVSGFLDISYNQFGQVTLGLEGDFSPNAYRSGYYLTYLNLAADLESEKKAVTLTMSQFGNWYRFQFKDISPPSILVSQDLLGTGKRMVWYSSPFYRIGLYENQAEGKTSVVDFRIYDSSYDEPYNTTRNSRLDLEINLPSVIDGVSNKNEIVNLPLQIEGINKIQNWLEIVLKGGKKINLYPDSMTLSNFDQNEVIFLKPLQEKLAGNDLKINFGKNIFKDYEYRYFSQPVIAIMTVKKIVAVTGLLVLSLIILLFAMYFKRPLIVLAVKLGFIVILLGSLVFVVRNGQIFQTYYVSDEEIAAMQKIQMLPEGSILVSDSNCLNCQIEYYMQPVIFSGYRRYVKDISARKVVYNNQIITTKETRYQIEAKFSRQQIRRMLDISGVKYIYLVKYGDYEELLPFSPGDLGVERVFNNAHTEIWKRNEN